MSELFTEAIADAKKIREVAEENAKKAILESVTPKIREFIESQLLEQDDEEKNEGKNDKVLKGGEDKKAEGHCATDEMVDLDESAISSLLGLIGEDIGDLGSASQDVMNGALQEAMTMLNESERAKILNLANKFNKTSENLNSSSLYNHNKEKQMTRDKYYEIDLKALREAVEDEMGDLGGEMPDLPTDDIMADDLPDEEDPGEAGGSIPEDEVEDAIQKMIDDLGLELGGEDLDLDADLDAGEDLDDLPEDEEGEEEPEQLDEVFDIDPRMLQQELRNIRRRVNEASEKGLAHETGGIPKDFEHHFGGKGSANSKGGDFGGGKPGKDVLAEMRYALRNQRRQNTSLQNKLTKYRSAVDTLREQLEELNLFNAKLLYVNKLLQNKTINESQKRSIVKALDEAKDLREAKVLYKNLTESFSSKSSRSRSRSLNESAALGGASRATRSASAHNASSEVDRWARLAGLKK
jgi:hypothetical protein